MAKRRAQKRGWFQRHVPSWFRDMHRPGYWRVRVRVLLDGIGSGLSLDKAHVERLKQAGCAFAFYHPIASWRIDRVNRRTHRRILVVDGRVGFSGGVGFSDEWLGDADAPNHWREVHARLEGPIVGKLRAAFQDHWFKELGESLSGTGEFPNCLRLGISAPNLRVRADDASLQDHRNRWNFLSSRLSNFDAPSAQINEELDLTVYDRAFGCEMQEVFERDLSLEALHAGRFRETIVMERLVEWVMLPFHSQV